jgi:GAF domain-containing protein
MPMRAQTISLTEDTWTVLEAQAGRLGVSAAQLVRDATLCRLSALAAHEAGEGARDPERLAELHATGLLDSPAEEAFDRFTRLAARLLHVPIALITLVDADRQVFKSQVGLPAEAGGQTPLSHSVCQHALGSRDPLVVGDCRYDARLRGNGAITECGVVAYLGVPLVTPRGHALGTLCAIDVVPRDWTGDEVATVVDLASSVLSEIELRRPQRVR